MSSRPLRFIHTSDWHLERPLSGVADVPDSLRAVFRDAPYLAAERVVDAALVEKVDFVLLAGDIIDVELAGPCGVAFLLRQFERLRERGIEVYWAGGRSDHPSRWPAAIALPDNVRRLSARRPEEAVYTRDQTPLARIAGLSRHRSRKMRAEDFWPDADGLPSIALAHGPVERTTLAARAMSYWALGGKHTPATLFDSPHVAHYCGSPQGRRPSETGPHGCTLVEIDDAARVRTRFIPTEVVHWRQQRITIDPTTTREALERSLVERARSFLAGAASSYVGWPSRPSHGDDAITAVTNAGASSGSKRDGLEGHPPSAAWLVSWTIAGHGPLIAALRHGPLAAELLAELRRQCGHATPVAWSVSLELEAASAAPPSWFERDSLLGDYLRSLAQFETNDGPSPALASRLDCLLDDRQRAGRAACVLAPAAETDRLRVLQKAAALGADLIGPEETLP
ncbi:MAG TPA: DNA repair exonuclease [Pirellulales bacterium]|nr:DNA repair exonuclease [Pirellulales bacterium]